MVLELDFGRPFPRQAQDLAAFRKVLKGAFAHRRKTIVNSLMTSGKTWMRETLVNAMLGCGIDPGRRAETLDMEAFLCLASALGIDKRKEGC